jgi:hypothetical protein
MVTPREARGESNQPGSAYVHFESSDRPGGVLAIRSLCTLTA